MTPDLRTEGIDRLCNTYNELGPVEEWHSVSAKITDRGCILQQTLGRNCPPSPYAEWRATSPAVLGKCLGLTDTESRRVAYLYDSRKAPALEAYLARLCERQQEVKRESCNRIRRG